jgi:proteasome lid subunit RPN8/RPN11
MSDEPQRVWLILTKFRVVGENPIGLTVGSQGLVQCFVPETIIEVALKETDAALRAEGMMRIDVIKCVEFEGSMQEYDVPDFVKRDVEQARSKQKTVIGTFFTSPDTASYQSENDRVD